MGRSVILGSESGRLALSQVDLWVSSCVRISVGVSSPILTEDAPMRTLALLCFSVLLPPLAYGQDEFDDLPNYGDDEPLEDDGLPEAEAPPEVLDEEALDEDEDLEDAPFDEEEDGELSFDEDDDLLGGEEAAEGLEEGVDTAQIFSAVLEETKTLPGEERSARWDVYLQTYPKTVYRERIATLQQQAMDDLYAERIDTSAALSGPKRQIMLTESALLENINPATRVKFGFDWGLPDWINLMADAEYALTPRVSVHAGARKRYTGWSLEPGARVAFLKSTALQSVGSLLLDTRVNVNPAFFALRPQVAFGSKIGERVDVQAQGGVELASADGFWTQTAIGGGQVAVRASRGVSLFAEGSFYAKYLGWPGGVFRFHLVGFGMKFFPGQKGAKDLQDPMEVTLGASVPWSYYPIPNWEYHQGSVTGQASFYLDE
jgi:hypothetical protein